MACWIGPDRRPPVPRGLDRKVSGTVYLFQQPVWRPQLQDDLFAGPAELQNHFMMHSFRAGGPPSTFLTGSAVDEITKTGVGKTESTSQYKIGGASRRQVGSKRNGGQSIAGVSELLLPRRVREMMKATIRTFG